MLARVVKQTNSLEILPFQIPEIGHHESLGEGIRKFTLPVLDEMPALEETSDEPIINQFSAEEILQDAKDEAAQILRQAEQDSEMIAQATREKALLEVEQKIAEGIEQNLAEIRQKLAGTIEEISLLQEDITNRVERDLVELALDIAKKVVGREVKLDRDISLALVQASLKKLDDRIDAKIHLHPEDFAYVAEHRESLEGRGTLELVEDNSISIGGCLVHTETGDIDARIESQFEEIAHGLLDI